MTEFVVESTRIWTPEITLINAYVMYANTNHIQEGYVNYISDKMVFNIHIFSDVF